jgi:hypothetical protein
VIKRRYAGLVALLLVLATAALVAWRGHRQDEALGAVLQSVQRLSGQRTVACSELRAQRPLVLLALGQSNAGNHGSLAPTGLEPVTVVAEDRCVLADDPLPGATGAGGSIWRRLPDALARQGVVGRPVVLGVLAVDATSIGDWTRDGSPLRRSLDEKLASMQRVGLMPSLVLWQQGEADAMAGSGTQAYAEGLAALASALSDAGSNAPVLLARSTTCRTPASVAIHAAIEAAPVDNPRLRLGPDTDLLQGSRMRADGCHFTADGLEAAAKMWAERIKAQLPSPAP